MQHIKSRIAINYYIGGMQIRQPFLQKLFTSANFFSKLFQPALSLVRFFFAAEVLLKVVKVAESKC